MPSFKSTLVNHDSFYLQFKSTPKSFKEYISDYFRASTNTRTGCLFALGVDVNHVNAGCVYSPGSPYDYFYHVAQPKLVFYQTVRQGKREYSSIKYTPINTTKMIFELYSHQNQKEYRPALIDSKFNIPVFNNESL